MLKISKMTGKLEGLVAINTNTVTNKFCQKMSKTDSVCKKCYSMNALKTYRSNCQNPWQLNSKLLTGINFKPFFINNAFIRLNAHGELINELHFVNLIKLAEFNPQSYFVLWTKRKNIVQNVLSKIDKPENLRLIYSNPKIDSFKTIPPKSFDMIFNVVHKKQLGMINCGKRKCVECKKCYNKDYQGKVIIEKLK